MTTKPRNSAQNAITKANAATKSSGRAKMKTATARDNKPRSMSAHHVNRYMRFTSSIIGLVILPPVWGTHQASSLRRRGTYTHAETLQLTAILIIGARHTPRH